VGCTYHHLERYDDEIDPDPHDLQPQAIAERVAGAMRAAFDSGRPRSIMLHTVRLGAVCVGAATGTQSAA